MADGRALVVLVALLAFGVTASVTALIMFVFASFVVGVLGQELWRGVGARRAMTSEGPARALVSLVRRNRRRYGGYTVHLGMAVLFVGVAASSAFQHARDVRLTPGQTATVGGYQVTYVRPTARVDERDGGVERSPWARTSGAQERLEGRATCTPSAATTRRRRRSPRAGSCAGSSRARPPRRSA